MRSLFDTIQNYRPMNQQEETGVKYAKLVSEELFSLETVTVNGHVRKGIWVPGHLHFNLTYLAEVEESEELCVQEEENSAVQWWSFEEVLKVSTEPWMIEHIYKKLIERSRRYHDINLESLIANNDASQND